MRNPFRYFKTSLEVTRLAVMMYIRFPLSLRQVEDLFHLHRIPMRSATSWAIFKGHNPRIEKVLEHEDEWVQAIERLAARVNERLEARDV